MRQDSGMRWRSVSLLWAALAASACASESLTLRFLLAEKEIGKEVWSLADDGSFQSSYDIDLLGRKIASTVNGRLEQNRLHSYKQTVMDPSGETKIDFDGKTVKVERGGKPAPEQKLVMKTGAAFSNFNTQLVRTLIARFEPKMGARQEIETYLLDAVTHLKVTVTDRGLAPFERAGRSENVHHFRVEITMTSVDYALNEKGQVVGMDVPAQMFQAVADGYEGVFVDPTTKYPEVSQPTFTAVAEKSVKVKMRDGVELVCDVARPGGDGKFPAILTRTPYGRTPSFLEAEWWAKRGYAFVSQDCRGRGDSSGAWLPFENEKKDGFDTIAWLAKQPWCDGNVGMIGASYGGMVQWQAAVMNPPALKAIVPQVSPPSAFFNIPWDHGVFFLWGNLWWAGVVREKTMNFSGFGVPSAQKLKTLPLSKLDEAIWGKTIPFYDSWLERDRPSDYPGFAYTEQIHRLRIPTLMITGWWDGDLIGTQLNWLASRRGGNSQRWLVAGPWTHMFNSSSRLGDIDYGPTAIADLDTLYLRFFDTHLKRKRAGLDKVARAQVFVTGENRWRNLDDWPPSDSKPMSLYLSAPSKANGGNGGGKLHALRPASQRPSRYTYDPSKVTVPKEMENIDPNEATTKVDLADFPNSSLLFKSDPLSADLTMIGPIRLELHFATSAKDTDFFARIFEIEPAGVMRAIQQPGKIGAKYLSGWDGPKLLRPGRGYRATIELWDVAHKFKKGSMIVISISSEMFPLYARNLNTGEPIKNATRMVVARQTIFHDAKRPSRLTFRTLP